MPDRRIYVAAHLGRHWPRWLTALVPLAAMLAGCGPEPQIRQYTVPKMAISSAPQDEDSLHGLGSFPGLGGIPAAAASAKPQTMLGAIVLAGPSAWFFKVTADTEAIAAHRDEIKAFLKSVVFSKDGERPTWELPPGWKEGGPKPLRVATLEISTAAAPLELAISQLSRAENDAEYILLNVNRWRGQMSLPETTSEQLDKESERFAIGEFPCVLVELTGKGSRGMEGPFAGGLPKDHPSIGSASGGSPSPQRAGQPKLEYTVPDSWNELPASGFRLASFEALDGQQKADISVSVLSLQGGDVTANVNRWRGQVSLPEQPADELAASLRPVKGKGVEWQVVNLVGTSSAGEPQAILGAIGRTSEAAWFVKLTAPPPLADREQAPFEQFIQSLQVP